MSSLDMQKEQALSWFTSLRNDICARFERLEDELAGSGKSAGKFERTHWDRSGSEDDHSGSKLQGGGEMSVMRGRVFEKVGVNISCVHGTFAENFAAQIPGASDSNGQFWAAGISLVAHMQSPLVPAVRMNTRMICTSKSWFGG